MIDAATFNDIVNRVGAGEPVRQVIAVFGVNPNTFYSHIALHEADAKRYAHAKLTACERLADEIVHLSDEPLIGTVVKETKDGAFTETGDNVARSRLMVDSRKWVLSKLLPKKYGEHSSLEVSGQLDLGLLEQRISDGRKRLTDSDPG